MVDTIRDIFVMIVCGWFLVVGKFGFGYSSFFGDVKRTDRDNLIGFRIGMAILVFIFIVSGVDLYTRL